MTTNPRQASSRNGAEKGAVRPSPGLAGSPRPIPRTSRRAAASRTAAQAGRPIGDPPGCRVVRAQPDALPVEFDAPQCCYAAWLTPELMRQTETRPPRRPPSKPAAAPAEPESDGPDGQLAFAA